MAGAGYKLYATGDVLSASDVNSYLQEQTVMRFASSAARTSALSAVLAEGMISYLVDTNAVEVYDGSAWVGIGNSGDITGVTAGTGISGGGTSGTVTVTNSMATAITTAGDLIKGTGSGTFDRLGIGSTGQVLTVSGGAPTWATAAGGGGMTLLTSGSLSGASTTVSFTPTGYINALLVIQGGAVSANDQIFFRINGNSGSVYQSSYTTRQGTTGATNYVSFTNSQTSLLTDGTCSAGTDINATFLIYEVAKTANHAFECHLNYVTSLGEAQNNWTGKINDTNTVTSVSIHRLATGNLSGNYYLYGIK